MRVPLPRVPAAKTTRHPNVASGLAMLLFCTALGACDASVHAGTADDSMTSRVNLDLNDELTARLVDVYGSLDPLTLPSGGDLSKLPQSALNPLTATKVELGQLLYHETAMGQSSMSDAPETFSCASCHFASAGFQAGRVQGLADGGSGFSPRMNMVGMDADIQPIRTPSSMNTAFQDLMLWNGQFGGGMGNDQFGNTDDDFVQLNAEGLPGLEVQAIKGLAVHRMGGGAEMVAQEFAQYDALFRAAFGNDGDVATRRNAGLAIAAFERTLVSDEAPFQQWLRGNPTAMSDQEMRGALVFFGDQASCSTCHSGPALSSMSFHSLGMADLDSSVEPSEGEIPEATRLGRGGFTNDPADDFKFKTPQLYNLADSPFYGHGATFDTLQDLVAYKNAGVPQVANSNLAPEFQPLGLTDDQQADLVAFLETGLYDADLARYEPQVLPSGNCFPVNDAEARDDLGCDSTGTP